MTRHEISGTLDGYIDFALPAGITYQFTPGELRALMAAMAGAVDDVQRNCLYDRDALLGD